MNVFSRRFHGCAFGANGFECLSDLIRLFSSQYSRALKCSAPGDARDYINLKQAAVKAKRIIEFRKSGVRLPFEPAPPKILRLRHKELHISFCRGGTPWPPDFPIHGRPRSAAP